MLGLEVGTAAAGHVSGVFHGCGVGVALVGVDGSEGLVPVDGTECVSAESEDELEVSVDAEGVAGQYLGVVGGEDCGADGFGGLVDGGGAVQRGAVGFGQGAALSIPMRAARTAANASRTFCAAALVNVLARNPRAMVTRACSVPT